MTTIDPNHDPLYGSPRRREPEIDPLDELRNQLKEKSASGAEQTITIHAPGRSFTGVVVKVTADAVYLSSGGRRVVVYRHHVIAFEGQDPDAGAEPLHGPTLTHGTPVGG
jgi:hypothetical protein